MTKAELSERETKGERTRRRIMAEALAMIDEVGMDAISQDAVAKKVGITQSALRHHFPDPGKPVRRDFRPCLQRVLSIG
ncbi:MAG: helix-turn-helix transcriptional regulator [Novosphingobium sp.]|nr:helix-turn-helix transcriptional regulator [Novosphingobium sp.]